MTKRTIAEWVTVAKVSRGVGHLFVEGDSDARLLMHTFGYPENIDIRLAKDIDAEGIESHPYWGGFKLRLMKLAKAVSNERNIINVACLVDADFSPFVGYAEQYSSLFETKYANLPVSTFVQDWYVGLLIKAYGITLTNADWSRVVDSLKLGFIARYVSGGSKRPLPAPEMQGYISYKANGMEFDKIAYLSSYFQVSKADATSILNDICEFANIMGGDLRMYINSNDLFSITYGVVRKMGNHGGALSKDSIKHAFFGAFDGQNILKQDPDGVLQWVSNF